MQLVVVSRDSVIQILEMLSEIKFAGSCLFTNRVNWRQIISDLVFIYLIAALGILHKFMKVNSSAFIMCHSLQLSHLHLWSCDLLSTSRLP